MSLRNRMNVSEVVPENGRMKYRGDLEHKPSLVAGAGHGQMRLGHDITCQCGNRSALPYTAIAAAALYLVLCLSRVSSMHIKLKDHTQ